MKFNHRVKFNGVYYDKGQNVPIDDKKAENKANTKPKDVLEKEDTDDFSQYMNAPEETSVVQYTKTEINRMSTADLKKLAKENGINDSLSGAELKKVLIEKFDL